MQRLADELQIRDKVCFAGWSHDLEAVYYGSDIVALTSDNEGTPVCVIEALACGRAVVATNVGGVADVLEEGKLGLIVPAGNESAFAEALMRLADPVERARFAGLGRDLVLSKYSIGRLVRDIEALYSELLVEERGRRNSRWNAP